MPSFGVRMAEARIRQGVTKAKVASLLGVSTTTVHAWESGTRPKEHQLARVAEFLGEDPIQLQKELFGVERG